MPFKMNWNWCNVHSTHWILLNYCTFATSELHHHKVIPAPASSPPEMVTKSGTVEALLKPTSRKRKHLDSVITNQKVELMDATVKIEEMPLTVPFPNHSHSVSLAKEDSVANNVILKKTCTEKASGNKKSPRKQIPTRGKVCAYLHIRKTSVEETSCWTFLEVFSLKRGDLCVSTRSFLIHSCATVNHNNC